MAQSWSRRIPVEGCVNGTQRPVDVIVHRDTITLEAGPGIVIEFPASVWHLLTMRVITRLAAMCRRQRPR